MPEPLIELTPARLVLAGRGLRWLRGSAVHRVSDPARTSPTRGGASGWHTPTLPPERSGALCHGLCPGRIGNRRRSWSHRPVRHLFGPLLVVANIFAFALAWLLYRAGPSSSRPTERFNLGRTIKDYYYGREGDPSLAGFDLKLFSYRPSLIGLELLAHLARLRSTGNLRHNHHPYGALPGIRPGLRRQLLPV